MRERNKTYTILLYLFVILGCFIIVYCIDSLFEIHNLSKKFEYGDVYYFINKNMQIENLRISKREHTFSLENIFNNVNFCSNVSFKVIDNSSKVYVEYHGPYIIVPINYTNITFELGYSSKNSEYIDSIAFIPMNYSNVLFPYWRVDKSGCLLDRYKICSRNITLLHKDVYLIFLFSTDNSFRPHENCFSIKQFSIYAMCNGNKQKIYKLVK